MPISETKIARDQDRTTKEGTYRWRTVGSPAIVAHILNARERVVACPTADGHHRVVTVITNYPVGTVGELRYVSQPGIWGRLEFEKGL